MIEEKKALRRQLKEIRNSIPEELRKEFSVKILLNLEKINEYKNAERILLFANAGSEVFTDDIFLDCVQKKKEVYYPKVSGEDMVFVKVSDLKELVPGYREIREPADSLNIVFTGKKPVTINGSEGDRIGNVSLTELDVLSNVVIICPGLGFSKAGERIGYGGGYYDRFLSQHPGLYRIGICFEAQICDHIPADENDFRMNNIVTESNIY